MKCSVVVEWMHHYLDDDISEENEATMMEHIAQCSQCKESFRMLKSLSRELEELPLVTPKFSLVDAIMPQLDALDRARSEKSASNEEMTPVTPVTNISDHKKRFLSSTAARTMIGAAAAVAILGVAIFNHSPQELSDAQIQYQSTTTSGTESAASTDDRVNNRSSNDQDVAMSSMAPDNEQGAIAYEAENGSSIDQVTPVPTEVDVPSEQADQHQPASPKVGQQVPSTVKTDSPTEKKDVPVESSNVTTDNTVGPDVTAPVKEQPQVSGPEADVPKETVTGDQPIEGLTLDSVSDDKEPRLYAIVPSPWDAPDGSMTAVVESNKLVIYQLPNGSNSEKTIIQSIDLVGTWVSGEWSSDSKVFTYRLSQNDKVSVHTYQSGTEGAIISP